MKSSPFIRSAVFEVVFLNILLLTAGLIGMATHGWQTLDWLWLACLQGFGIGSGLFYLHKLKVALTPLNDIARIADEIAAGVIGPRITETRRTDELGDVCRNVNAMLNQMESCFTKQREALAAASWAIRSGCWAGQMKPISVMPGRTSATSSTLGGRTLNTMSDVAHSSAAVGTITAPSAR